MKKEKSVYQKIRKTWEINPRTRVREDATEVRDQCKCCKNTDPLICEDCQLGGA